MDELEQLTKTAHASMFNLSFNRAKNPSVVLVLLNNESDARVAYVKLVEWAAGVNKLTMIVFKQQNNLDISLVKKETGESLNIKNLIYSQERLDEFIEGEPSDTSFVLCFANNARTILMQPNTAPIVIGGYLIR